VVRILAASCRKLWGLDCEQNGFWCNGQDRQYGGPNNLRVTATQAKNQFGAHPAALSGKTMAQRKRAFAETYGDWIDAQNTHFEKQGLWCDGLVPWMEPVQAARQVRPWTP
jgi:hypothetical protein